MFGPCSETEHVPSRRPSWAAWLGSLGLHVVVLVLFAGISLAVESHPVFEPLMSAQWVEEAPEPPEFRFTTALQVPQPAETGGRTAVAPSAARLLSDRVEVAKPEFAATFRLAAALESNNTSTRMGYYYGTFAGDARGTAGSGTGQGDDIGSGFFGKPADNSSFVFVLDRSGSMSAPHRGAEGINRFQRLQLELIRFISQLQPSQRFYIVFFNENAEGMPASTLVPATEENKARYLEWVARLRPEGHTDPRFAIRMAMKLQPDHIYFLSDGDLDEGFRKQMMRLEPGPWQMHTYTFGAGYIEFMKYFAEKHNGDYTLVR